MPSKSDLRRWASAGGRASFSSITDPAARAEAIRARCRKMTIARALKYPSKGKREYLAPGEEPIDIPSNAFVATDDDGEWETVGEGE